ncbi:MAG: hypothetical protein ACE5G3_03815 [Gammaproteobacteria bacterium]
MSRHRSRRRRHSQIKGEEAVREVTEFIEDNPVTSAVFALAAGALATSVFKMTVNKPPKAKQSAHNNSPNPGAE